MLGKRPAFVKGNPGEPFASLPTNSSPPWTASQETDVPERNNGCRDSIDTAASAGNFQTVFNRKFGRMLLVKRFQLGQVEFNPHLEDCLLNLRPFGHW